MIVLIVISPAENPVSYNLLKMNDIAIYNANQRKIALLSEDKVKKNFVFIGVLNFFAFRTSKHGFLRGKTRDMGRKLLKLFKIITDCAPFLLRI